MSVRKTRSKCGGHVDLPPPTPPQIRRKPKKIAVDAGVPEVPPATGLVVSAPETEESAAIVGEHVPVPAVPAASLNRPLQKTLYKVEQESLAEAVAVKPLTKGFLARLLKDPEWRARNPEAVAAEEGPLNPLPPSATAAELPATLPAGGNVAGPAPASSLIIELPSLTTLWGPAAAAAATARAKQVKDKAVAPPAVPKAQPKPVAPAKPTSVATSVTRRNDQAAGDDVDVMLELEEFVMSSPHSPSASPELDDFDMDDLTVMSAPLHPGPPLPLPLPSCPLGRLADLMALDFSSSRDEDSEQLEDLAPPSESEMEVTFGDQDETDEDAFHPSPLTIRPRSVHEDLLEAERRRALPQSRRLEGFALDQSGRILVHPLALNRVQVASDGGDRSDSGSGDESDYAEQAEKDMRHHEHEKRFDQRLRTVEEDDEEDEEEFEAELADAPSTPPAQKQSKKSRQTTNKSGVEDLQHLVESPVSDEDSDDEDGPPHPSGGYTRSPLPAACKEEVVAARQAYDEDLRQLAEKRFESSQAPRVWHASSPCGMSSKRGTPTRGRKKNPRTILTNDVVSLADWNQFVKQEYDARMNEVNPEDPDAQTKHFADIVQWYEDGMKAEVEHLKVKGKFAAPVARMVRQFINLAQGGQAYESLGIHVFGFAIDVNGLGSVMWGGSPEYGELRGEWSTSIRGQLKDYKAMFRTLQMRKRSKATQLTQVPQVNFAHKEDESKRDYWRRIIRECMARELGLCEAEAGTFVPGKPPTMIWDLAELGYKHQVRIVNWPSDLTAQEQTPHVGWKICAALADKAGPLLRSRHQWGLEEAESEEDDEDDGEAQAARMQKKVEAVDGALHLERWTEEEREMDFEDQADIAVLITVDGTELQFVKDRKSYKKTLGALKALPDENAAPSKPKAKKSKTKERAGPSRTPAPAAAAGSKRPHDAAPPPPPPPPPPHAPGPSRPHGPALGVAAPGGRDSVGDQDGRPPKRPRLVMEDEEVREIRCLPPRSRLASSLEIVALPAGAPVVPIRPGMTPAQELEECWPHMPGRLLAGEIACRYQEGEKISRVFYVCKWNVRTDEYMPFDLD
ncbi:hypothetical protein DFH09DRAFT_1092217 [Mycena vulgaris]|nr:hypothetical protein DFH09DRAFT_1092217 [Mycena vulgaris]